MARRIKALAGRPLEAGRPWFRVVNEADGDGPVRVDVYDEIGGSFWSDGVSASDFVAQVAAIPMNRAIECHVNSPGGDVFDGLAIYNALANRPGPVTTVVDGLAASAASFIAQAGKTRLLSPGSMMMIHDASGLCIGNQADMGEMAELLGTVSDNIAEIYSAHGHRPASAFRDAMRAETWYKAQDAVDAGLADRLAERPAPEGASNRFDLSLFARVPAWVRNADGEGDGQACKTCGGSGRLKHPGTGKNGMKCPGCDGSGKYDPDSGGDDDEPDDPDEGDGDGPDDRGRKPAARRPAGRLLGIESMPLANEALPVHHTATVEKPWDGPAAVKAMPNDANVLKYCHAWQDTASDDGTGDDPDGDADDRKSSYKFPHHDGKGAPANVSACNNGLARLSGADIPEGDRAGVEAHLRAHLKDAGDDDDDGADDSAGKHGSRDALEGLRAALPSLKGGTA